MEERQTMQKISSFQCQLHPFLRKLCILLNGHLSCCSVQHWNLNFEQMHHSSWDGVSLTCWIEPNQTGEDSSARLSSSRHDWCDWLHSLFLSTLPTRLHFCSHVFVFFFLQASCLFRSALEMNLTHLLSLCKVCSDWGRALCEIEVGSRQYPALFGFLSVWRL